jgi:uncharacterized membrane protein YgcG
VLSTFVAEAWFWGALWAVAWPLILAALSLALAQSLAQTLLINHVLLDGRNIAVPRAYAFADLWFTFMGLIAGAVLAVVRVATGLAMALLALMRIDRSLGESRASDLGASTFDAVLAIDLQHNHPALLAAVDCLQRCAEAAAARKLLAPGAPGASPRPLNRWLLALTLARNPALRALRREDATSDGALLAAPGLLEVAGLKRAEKVEGPSGPAYGIWLEGRAREAAKRGGAAPAAAAAAAPARQLLPEVEAAAASRSGTGERGGGGGGGARASSGGGAAPARADALEQLLVSQQQPQLPPAWRAATSAEGKTFYYNSVTKETRWTLPAALDAGAPPKAVPPPQPQLPPAWRAATSADGKTFYFNSVTRETRWTPPTAPDAALPPKAEAPVGPAAGAAPLLSRAAVGPPPRARALATVAHNFDGAADGELRVRKGERVAVEGGVDSQGWVRVAVEGAPERRGEVPASYLRYDAAASSPEPSLL